MGRGKSKHNKKSPRPVKKKRQLPEGLRRWNNVRSYLSKENKKNGKKYSGVELNSLVKTFLLEYFDQDFNQRDIEKYVSLEVPDFYSNALNVSIDKLGPFKYFQIDSAIRDLPTGLFAIVDANGFGYIEIKTSEYNYHDGLSLAVEGIRLEAQNASKGYNFHGFIIKNDRPSRVKNKEPDHIILFVLYVDGVSVGDPNVTYIPISESNYHSEDEEPEIEKVKKRITEKYEKKVAKQKKNKSEKQDVDTKASNEKIKLEIEKLKQQNLKADKILKLIKAGYTKAEIKEMGL